MCVLVVPVYRCNLTHNVYNTKSLPYNVERIYWLLYAVVIVCAFCITAGSLHMIFSPDISLCA